jgi:hypothetical protein
MLAERDRLFELADGKVNAAYQIEETLPDDVRLGKVSIMEGDPLYGGSYSNVIIPLTHV